MGLSGSNGFVKLRRCLFGRRHMRRNNPKWKNVNGDQTCMRLYTPQETEQLHYAIYCRLFEPMAGSPSVSPDRPEQRDHSAKPASDEIAVDLRLEPAEELAS